MTQQHDNYKNPCVVTITKLHQGNYDYDYYTLQYQDESYTLTGTLEDIINELSEHMDNMKGDK